VSPGEIVMKGVLLPMAAGLVPLAVGTRIWRRDEGRSGIGAGLAIAVPTTLAVALWAQEGEAIWSLRQKWQWLWVAACGAGVGAAAVGLMLDRLAPRAPAVAMRSAVAIVIGLAAMLLLKAPGFEDARGRMIVLLAAAVPAWLAASSRRAIGREVDGALQSSPAAVPGWVQGTCLWLAASGLSGVVLASGFAKLAVPLGAIAALSMAAAVLSLRGRRSLGAAGVAVAAGTLGMAAVLGWAYDDSPVAPWCFLAMPLALVALAAPMPARGAVGSLLRITLVLVVVGIAAGVAVAESGMLAPRSAEAEQY